MDSESINTGLTIRGFEVWAITPHHYRHGHTFFLRVPGEFQTESYQRENGEWVVGFNRPDGQRQITYCSYKAREEAEHARTTYPHATMATLNASLNVGYKKTDEKGDYLPYVFCKADEAGAKAWGAAFGAYPEYAPLKFDLTEEEAAQVNVWREKADADWFGANPDFLPREKKITDAQVAGLSETAAEFVVDAKETFGDAAVAVITKEAPTTTECLECGAVYEEAGHVESGGMCCDRC